MAISSIKSTQASAKPEDIPLEQIASSKTLSEGQKVTEMTRQFEAVLLRQILTQAQKPAFQSKLLQNSGVSNSIYQDMMVNQLADKISSARTIGLAQELETQLTRQIHGETLKESPQTIESPKSGQPRAASVHPTKSPRL